jgi:hypothetical protein
MIRAETMPAVAYYRMSSKKQDKRIPAQRVEVEKYAAATPDGIMKLQSGSPCRSTQLKNKSAGRGRFQTKGTRKGQERPGSSSTLSRPLVFKGNTGRDIRGN